MRYSSAWQPRLYRSCLCYNRPWKMYLFVCFPFLLGVSPLSIRSAQQQPFDLCTCETYSSPFHFGFSSIRLVVNQWPIDLLVSSYCCLLAEWRQRTRNRRNERVWFQIKHGADADAVRGERSAKRSDPSFNISSSFIQSMFSLFLSLRINPTVVITTESI